MKIKPTGHFVLVEVKPVEETFPGSKILSPQSEIERERKGRDIGRVLEFGPIAFLGFATCKKPEDWGVRVGDLVEFNRYDGKMPRVSEQNPEFENYRIINDNDIIAVIEE